jgi:hypothetical protein
LLVTGRTEREYHLEALNDFEMFNHLGADEGQSSANDELAKNKICYSKLTLNWIIYN